ncbi:hypothetical protein L1987_66261 [Smallanthus sonchifolius]|uniref:Uncharacterized protein n=1 Tax=Smallanthus sonchifolius TaxID=185202 RepID=A0ACB9BWU1_9ASTR|nr:hypothetical protein L1987_66261 [Smallanthus sonchifolius]
MLQWKHSSIGSTVKYQPNTWLFLEHNNKEGSQTPLRMRTSVKKNPVSSLPPHCPPPSTSWTPTPPPRSTAVAFSLAYFSSLSRIPHYINPSNPLLFILLRSKRIAHTNTLTHIQTLLIALSIEAYTNQ